MDNPRLPGDFVRTSDASEFVRIGAPVYLKTGNSALEGHGAGPIPRQVDDILARVEIVAELLDRNAPDGCSPRAGATPARR